MFQNKINTGRWGSKLTVNQRHSRSISTTGAHSSEVAVQELWTSYFQTFFYYFRGKLVHAIINRPVDDMLNGTAFVVRSTMLTYVLDTPIPELTVCKHVDFS